MAEIKIKKDYSNLVVSIIILVIGLLFWPIYIIGYVVSLVYGLIIKIKKWTE